jgi:hypothetical protein
MDLARFDRLTKRLAGGRSRRSLLRGTIGGAAVAAAVPATWTLAQEASPPASTSEADQENWLLVVNFGGAEIVPSADDPTRLTVTLSGVDRDAVAFTDHPQQQFVIVLPEQVVSAINGAQSDPLNAALVARMPLSRESEKIGVVLLAAAFDETTETLTLDVKTFGSAEAGTPVAFEPGQTTVLRGGNLFIDSVELREVFGASACSQAGGECFFRICCPGIHCLAPAFVCAKL